MAMKNCNQKLQDSKDMPKIVDITDQPEAVARYGGTKMLIAAPLQYNATMAQIPEGKVITSDQIRAHLAKEAGADFTCPLTAGIFINVCAHASAERESDKIPYWRTLKAKGELNEKYPEGIDGQKFRLEAEGHEVVQKGKRWFVKDFQNSLWELG
jgi:alkylated DNA nucleotide flippase Atl1